MKIRLISFLLLFSLVAPFAVTQSWLQLQKRSIKKEVKKEMIAGINKSELVFFHFSNKEATSKLRWEHDSEFEYNNQMYDVVEKIIVNDSTQLWCWWDHKETILNKKLQQLTLTAFENDAKSREKYHELYKFYQLVYIKSMFSWQLLVAYPICKTIFCKNIIYKFLSAAITLPPPKNS